jgi:IS4 transposase
MGISTFARPLWFRDRLGFRAGGGLVSECPRAEATRLGLRRTAIKKGKRLDPRSLIAAEFMILGTSLPKTGYTAKDILAVYRLRWQIELASKRLKSLLHIDKLPTRTERGSRSWLYAHLILALLCDDLSQDFLESSP